MTRSSKSLLTVVFLLATAACTNEMGASVATLYNGAHHTRLHVLNTTSTSICSVVVYRDGDPSPDPASSRLADGSIMHGIPPGGKAEIRVLDSERSDKKATFGLRAYACGSTKIGPMVADVKGVDFDSPNREIALR